MNLVEVHSADLKLSRPLDVPSLHATQSSVSVSSSAVPKMIVILISEFSKEIPSSEVEISKTSAWLTSLLSLLFVFFGPAGFFTIDSLAVVFRRGRVG